MTDIRKTVGQTHLESECIAGMYQTNLTYRGTTFTRHSKTQSESIVSAIDDLARMLRAGSVGDL